MSISGTDAARGTFAVLLGLALALGFWAAAWRRRSTSRYDVEDWGLGGRSFGPVLTWFLVGGDIYTAYTFVALPAAVCAYGAMGFWPVTAAAMAYPIAALALLRMWSVAHAHGIVTTADFVLLRFGSRALTLLVALAGIYLLVQYTALQVVGMETVFATMGLAGPGPLWGAFAISALFTYRAGLRAPALLSVVKDILLLWLILSVLIIVAVNGGWAAMFPQADNVGPVAPVPPAGISTYLTTAIAAAIALFLCPHAITGFLAAKNRDAVRGAIAGLPVYTVGSAIIGLFGLMAVREGLGGASVADSMSVMPRLVDHLLPGWVAGTAYAAVVIGAFVPAAIMSIAAANLFTRNVYREFLRPGATAAEQVRVSRLASLLVKFVAVLSVVALGLQFSIDTGMLVVLQTMPAVGLGLFTAWPHRAALVAGLLTGLGTTALLMYQIPARDASGAVTAAHFGGTSWPLEHFGVDGGHGVYVGLAALLTNLLVVFAGTPLLRALGVPDGVDRTRPDSYTADEEHPQAHRLDELLDGQPVPPTFSQWLDSVDSPPGK